MKCLAIVTTAAPPSASGQARVLAQLLGEQGGEPRHLFLTDQLHTLDTNEPGYGAYASLSTPRFQLMPTLNTPLFQRLNNYAGLARDVMSRAREITAALASHPVDVVVGCSGNPFDLPAAAIAARRANLPFVAYLFDDPVYQWEKGPYRRLARLWEKYWSRRADRVIVPNEVLAADLCRRARDARIAIVRNPVDLAAHVAAPPSPPRAAASPESPWTIIYTGSVYSAQASAFRNLVAALDRIGGSFNLHVYTAQSDAQVRENGLLGPYVHRHDHLPQAQSLTRQRDADILFLPLAFDSAISEVVRSSAPAKVAEYLASGRPILAHAPKDSFVASFFKERQAGYVVDEPDVNLLVTALRRLGEDARLREELIRNAQTAAREFSVENARVAFLAALVPDRT